MTHLDVFIIEGIGPDDKGNGRFEGSIISHVLRCKVTISGAKHFQASFMKGKYQVSLIENVPLLAAM